MVMLTSHSSRRSLRHPWTGLYKVESKLSDLNYKILPFTDSLKPLIVQPFENLYSWYSVPPITSLPNKPTLPLTRTYHSGDMSELCNFSDDFSNNEQDDHIDTSACDVHRYPVRTRRPPD